MARIDHTKPAMTPRMQRLDPRAWANLDLAATDQDIPTAMLVRDILDAWLMEHGYTNDA